MLHENADVYHIGAVEYKEDGLLDGWQVGDKELSVSVGSVWLKTNQKFRAQMYCSYGFNPDSPEYDTEDTEILGEDFDTLEAAINALMARFDRLHRQAVMEEFGKFEGEV